MSEENNSSATDAYQQTGSKPGYTIEVQGMTLLIKASGDVDLQVDINELVEIVRASKCFRDGRWQEC